MTLTHNEQTKLTATYVNGLAIAVVAVGAFAPLTATAAADGPASTGLRIYAGLCALASIALHLVARRILRRLTQ